MGKVVLIGTPNYTRVGTIEISRMQDISAMSLGKALSSIILNPGLFVPIDINGNFGGDWGIGAAYIGQGTFQVNSGSAMIRDSDDILRGISRASDTFNAATIGDGTWKVLLRYATTNTEQGLVNVTNGQSTVVGFNTEFTKIFEAGRRLIVAGAASTVLSVQDDTHLTLTAPYSGATAANQNFSVGGAFFSDVPTVADMVVYQYDSYSIVFSAGAPDASDIYFADVTISGGLLTAVTDKRSSALLSFTDNNYPNITPRYTNSPAFRVNGPTGPKVVLQTDTLTPPAPINFRVVDLKTNKNVTQSTTVEAGLVERNFETKPKAGVRFKWGYDTVAGTGGNATFTITGVDSIRNSTSDPEWVADSAINYEAMVGSWLTVPGYAQPVKIAAVVMTGAYGGNQQAIVCTVQNQDATSPDLTPYSSTLSNPAVMHSNATYYVISLQPLTADGSQNDNSASPITFTIGGEGSALLVVQDATVEIPVGVRFNCQIYACNDGQHVSGAGSLVPTGNFTCSATNTQTTISINPLVVVFPNLSSVGKGLTLNGHGTTISINVAGWTYAEQFEVAYSQKGKPSWSGTPQSDQKSIIRSGANIDIPSQVNSTYYMAVRPLICGQQVCADADIIYGTVNSGSLPANSGAFQLAPFYWAAIVSCDGNGNVTIKEELGTNMNGVAIFRAAAGGYGFNANECQAMSYIGAQFFHDDGAGTSAAPWGQFEYSSALGVTPPGVELWTWNHSNTLADGLLNGLLIIYGA